MPRPWPGPRHRFSPQVDAEVIFRQGDAGRREAYLVHDGRVEVWRRTPREKRLLRTLAKGDLLGEVALFSDAPHSATAVAMERVTLLVGSGRPAREHRSDEAQPGHCHHSPARAHGGSGRRFTGAAIARPTTPSGRYLTSNTETGERAITPSATLPRSRRSWPPTPRNHFSANSLLGPPGGCSASPARGSRRGARVPSTMRSSGRFCRIHSSGGRRTGRRRPESGSFRWRVLFHTQIPAYFSLRRMTARHA